MRIRYYLWYAPWHKLYDFRRRFRRWREQREQNEHWRQYRHRFPDAEPDERFTYWMQARKAIRRIREGSNSTELWAKFLSEDLEVGGFTLEDLGTNEGEILALRLAHCIKTCQGWIEKRRDLPSNALTRYLQARIKQAVTLHETLEEQEAIERFLAEHRAYTRALGVASWSWATHDLSGEKLSRLRELAQAGNFSLEEVGLTKEVVDLARRMQQEL